MTKEENYDFGTLQKKIKRVDNLIQDEVPNSPAFKKLERKRSKYVKQIAETDEWKIENVIDLDESERNRQLDESERYDSGSAPATSSGKEKEYSYKKLQKKILLVQSKMNDEEDSFGEDFQRLERKYKKYMALIKETPEWRESHPDGDSEDEDNKTSSEKGCKDNDTTSNDHVVEDDNFHLDVIGVSQRSSSFTPIQVPVEVIAEDDNKGDQLTGLIPDEDNLPPEKQQCKEMLLKLMALEGEKPGTDADLDEEFLITLCEKVSELLLQSPMVLRLSAPIQICADLHGQFFDLLRIFDFGGYPSKSDYLFLGDYVDRGKQSVEVVAMLFGFKYLFPEKLHLLRGNHEIANINRIYGFHDECMRKYSVKVYNAFCRAFNCMPVVAVVEETVVCMHAGISPSMMDLDKVDETQRPCEIPEEGWLCDFVWSDPDPDVEGFEESDRGVSYLFGGDALSQFLEKNDYELVVRGHQVVEDGYQFFNDRKLVTLFSAPNYCGEFDNAGAMMMIKADMTCSFQIFKPVKRRRQSLLKETKEGRDNGKEGTGDDEKKPGHKFFGNMDGGSTVCKEKSVDRKSYSRQSVDTGGSGFSEVFFSQDLTNTHKVEDLTRKNTSWGDIWEDLFYDDEQLAEFKYEAFVQSLEDD